MTTTMQVTVSGVRTTRCKVAVDQWTTDLVCADGGLVDPFLVAVDVGGECVELCRREKAAAAAMVGRTYRLEGARFIGGAWVPDTIAQVAEPRQDDLFGDGRISAGRRYPEEAASDGD
ncbi:MAG TPA: hypothetical protein VKA64_07995 [Gammaproteobacteria bacterium]|nr:hypothetical protein [Gammaproteobacteria bacterium]